MAENLAKQYEPNGLQQEFERKNEILRSRFLELSPEEYLDCIFGDREELIVVFGSVKNDKGEIVERGTVKRIHREDVWAITWRANAYLPYADFHRNYYCSRTLKAVRAFVVDCDGVTSIRLNKTLKYLWSSLPAQPTHVVNSGQGVHFVYVLSQPIGVKGLRWSVGALNDAIQDSFVELLKVDKHPVVHPYRFPGFRTKINTVATVFKVREPYAFEELMRLFKIGHRTQGEARREEKKEQARVLYLSNGKRAFFEWVLRRLFKNPPIPGRRQNSFFALGIVAYKCRREVPYEEAVETIPMIYEDMMDRNLHIGFPIEEAYEAFHKGYQPKYVRASWRYLSELLGWEYIPRKRNGRKREEHLKIARQIRELYLRSKWEEMEEHIKRLRDLGYSKRKIAEMVGIHHSTLYRRFRHLFE